MISDLNTFVQYFAALYFTICIDSVVTRRFWSPDYYKLVIKTIEMYDFKQSKNIRYNLYNQIKNTATALKDKSMKRGVFMLLLCVSIMLYSAFEKECNNFEYILYSYIIIIYCVIFLLSKFLLKTWLRLILSFMIPLFLFFIFEILKTFLIGLNINNSFLQIGWVKIFISCHMKILNNSKIMTCFLLVLPIVYQIYINWLYSRAYLKHIHNNLDEEYLKYDKTLQAIRNGDKTMADSVYNDFFAEAFFANNGQDTVITKFNEMVVKRIEIACIPLCGWKMVYFYFKKRNNILNHRTTINHTNFDTTEIIPKLSDHENNDLEKAVIEYETMPQKPSINEFCNKKHISVKQFKEHRNKRMKLQ